ncbi:MAG: SapC family protein [Novosphingobium sp.]
MASAPQAQLPLFYQDLMPLNSRDHGTWRSRPTDRAAWLVGQHAVPLTVEEFPQAARNYPIIFTTGDDPVPLALMGLNEGVNTFVDAEGKLLENVYVPAYVRRYPFLLAKLTPDASDLSLCFDPTTDLIGEYDEGAALFDGEKPSESCQAMLDFCQQFEEAGMRTGAFVEELKKHNLLMDGEVAIQIEGQEQPFVYRGFQMINQEALRELRGDVLRGWNQSGLLPLIYAHLFSLDLVREVFGRQVQQGTGPVAAPVPVTA